MGWEQTSDDLLNLGLDKNNISNQYMFYNIGSGWLNSQFSGSWMIRPVLRETPIILDVVNHHSSFSIYPNPASTFLYVDNVNLKFNDVIKIYHIHGVIVKEIRLNKNKHKIDIQDLSSGLYIVEFENYNISIFKKLIIR